MQSDNIEAEGLDEAEEEKRNRTLAVDHVSPYQLPEYLQFQLVRNNIKFKPRRKKYYDCAMYGDVESTKPHHELF